MGYVINTDQSGDPDQIFNKAPIVSEILFSDANPVIDSVCNISVNVSDPEEDPPVITWAVSGGKLAGNFKSATTWKTPSAPGVYLVNVAVYDGNNEKICRSKSVTASEKPAVFGFLNKIDAEGGFIQGDAHINDGGSLFAGDNDNNRQ